MQIWAYRRSNRILSSYMSSHADIFTVSIPLINSIKLRILSSVDAAI